MILLKHLVSGILLILFGISCISKKNRSDDPPAIPKEKIKIKNAWARPAQRGMMSGAYLTIVNGTDQVDTLIGVSTDAARSAEIHLSVEKNGISEMRPAGNLPIEANSRLKLEPGGYHIMLMQLRHDLSAGDSIAVLLHLSNKDSLSVRIPIKDHK